MKRARVLIAALALAALTTISGLSQTPTGKKSYTFRGKIEAVDKKAQTLRVDGEKVDGWMDAMTMDYRVDDRLILDKVKPGDRITATVYDGDEKLHNVQVVGKTTGNSKPKR